MSGRRNAPNDPDRPARILEATLTVIAEHGISRASHSRIAAEAGVSPGSLTYYFAGIDDIYAQAFRRLADEMSVDYEEHMAGVDNVDAAVDAAADLICGTYASHRSMSLIFEMYAYAKYNADVATLTSDWVSRSHVSLARHFSVPAARAIDALVEGWPMHREFQHRELDRDEVRQTLFAIAAAFPKQT